MTYYINPIWFYLMNISTGMKTLLFILGGVSLVVSIFTLIAWADDCNDFTDLDDNKKKIIKGFKKVIITSIMSILIGILVPSKETCIEMMIASQVTHENVTATKEEIYEIVDYVTDKMKEEEGGNGI